MIASRCRWAYAKKKMFYQTQGDFKVQQEWSVLVGNDNFLLCVRGFREGLTSVCTAWRLISSLLSTGWEEASVEFAPWCKGVLWVPTWPPQNPELCPRHFLWLWSPSLNTSFNKILLISSVQFSSVAQSCPTPCHPMNCSMPGLSVHHQLPESTQTHVHCVGDAIQPSHPLLPSSSAFNLSQHQGPFQWVSSSHQVAKVLEFQLQHQSFQWIFRTDVLSADWFDLAVQGTLKSFLQHHSSKAPILRDSAFFIVQLSHPYMTTGKTIAVTRWACVGKVTSLFFNVLSRLV